MPNSLLPDKSNGYEALAEPFMRIRNRHIGPTTALEGSRSLASGISIIDIGCGAGVPISELLAVHSQGEVVDIFQMVRRWGYWTGCCWERAHRSGSRWSDRP